MDNARLYKYYRRHGHDARWMTYRFPFIESKLRLLYNFVPRCDIVTLITCLFVAIVVTCSIASLSTVISNEKSFQDLKEETEKKVPRRRSIVSIRPTYNCIHKHLQQTNVFQEKTKKMLCKEHLELEILNSKINCISKLLNPEAQSEWRRSRSPRAYYRPINAEK